MNAFIIIGVGGENLDLFNESMEQPLNQPKYYGALCAPVVHHTMGGVMIHTATEVVKEDGTAIAGLFVAGEVTGGNIISVVLKEHSETEGIFEAVTNALSAAK